MKTMAKVELAPRRWVDDHEADEGEEAWALLGPRIVKIDGEEIEALNCTIYLGAQDFWQINIEKPTSDLRARYSPEQYLSGTDEDWLLLPISELVIA